MITWECNVGRAIRALLHDIVLVFVCERILYQGSSETGRHPSRSLIEFEYRALFLKLGVTAPVGVIWHFKGVMTRLVTHTSYIVRSARKVLIVIANCIKVVLKACSGHIRMFASCHLNFFTPAWCLSSPQVCTGLCFILYALCYPLFLLSHLPAFLENWNICFYFWCDFDVILTLHRR